MADDREPYEPLWASGLRRAPEPEPEPPAPAPAPPFPARFAAVAVALTAAAILLAGTLGTRTGEVTIADLPSEWGDIRMTCATTRIEGEGGALELFRCEAVGGGGLPPGLYRSPETIWQSDFDHRAALDHQILISPSGRLTGRAIYGP